MSISRKLHLKLLAPLIVSFLLFGCEKIKEAANFDMLYDLPKLQVIADSSLMEITDNDALLLEHNVSISLDSLRKKFDVKKIESAKFDYIRIEAETPQNSNLNWISKISAVVVANGISETEVGTYDGSKPDAKIIDLELTNAPLTPYLETENFTLKIYARVRPPLPASTTSIVINSRIRLTIQPV